MGTLETAPRQPQLGDGQIQRQLIVAMMGINDEHPTSEDQQKARDWIGKYAAAFRAIVSADPALHGRLAQGDSDALAEMQRRLEESVDSH